LGKPGESFIFSVSGTTRLQCIQDEQNRPEHHEAAHQRYPSPITSRVALSVAETRILLLKRPPPTQAI
jgi:hypothetical protein